MKRIPQMYGVFPHCGQKMGPAVASVNGLWRTAGLPRRPPAGELRARVRHVFLLLPLAFVAGLVRLALAAAG